MAARRVVLIGGGGSGTLTAVQLLRKGGAGLEITVVEPRATLGRGVAFGTPDPWHRLNVPAITMSGLPEDPDHFREWADLAPDAFPPRDTFGRYLGSLLEGSDAGSAASLVHVHTRATGIRDSDAFLVDLANGSALAADAVVIATGNELPVAPAFLTSLVSAADPRCIVDPWSAGSLDAIAAGETVAIIGTGHTALDLAASLIRAHGAARVVALSRHGDMPATHEDPWRPRPPLPVFTAAELAAFADPIEEARARIRAYPLGWRQALDSLRPINRDLWLALDESTRRRFATGHRREWEIHRSRLAPVVARDVAAWIDEGLLEVATASINTVIAAADGLRIEADEGAWDVDRVLVATGPSESPSASPLLSATIAAGLARPGSMDLGIDVHPYDYRIRDATGSESRPLFALGPIIRGSVWETIAIPEIRGQASRIAEQILAQA